RLLRDATNGRGNQREGAGPCAVATATAPATTAPPLGEGLIQTNTALPQPGAPPGPSGPRALPGGHRAPPEPPQPLGTLGPHPGPPRPPPEPDTVAPPPCDVITPRPPLQDGGGRAGLSRAQAAPAMLPGAPAMLPGCPLPRAGWAARR
ncbi:neural Wiskott-Aldrich syndrome protein-like, partial [Corvus kubaryi]|uniref:neural Wiskott-Aldrich syndrome protein-like n=1 Tax=Corvus kubaryi TaxID=68294 RepID=UPI001C0471D7